MRTAGHSTWEAGGPVPGTWSREIPGGRAFSWTASLGRKGSILGVCLRIPGNHLATHRRAFSAQV